MREGYINQEEVAKYEPRGALVRLRIDTDAVNVHVIPCLNDPDDK